MSVGGGRGTSVWGEGGMHEADLDVVEPVCGLKVGEPSLVIHIWVANVL